MVFLKVVGNESMPLQFVNFLFQTKAISFQILELAPFWLSQTSSRRINTCTCIQCVVKGVACQQSDCISCTGSVTKKLK